MQQSGRLNRVSPWYSVSWRVIGYPLLLLVLVGGVLRVQELVRKIDDRITAYETSHIVESTYRNDLRDVRESYLQILPKIKVIDASLPGMSTSAIDILTDHFEKQIRIQNLSEARTTIRTLDRIVTELLVNQDAIAKEEIARMDAVISTHLKEIDLLLGDTTIIPVDSHEQLNNEQLLVMERLSMARNWIETTSQEIGRRRVAIDEAQKQILIKKSDEIVYV